MKTKKKSTSKTLYPIRRASDFPATQGMLIETQKMFTSSIKSVKTQIGSIEKRLDSMDKRFDSMDKRFDSIELQIKSFIEEMRSDRHQIKIMVETQDQRNKFVIEGYEQLYLRQDRLEVKTEKRLKNIEDVVFTKAAEPQKSGIRNRGPVK